MGEKDLKIGDMLLLKYGNRWDKERVNKIIDGEVFTKDCFGFTRLKDKEWRFLSRPNWFEKLFV